MKKLILLPLIFSFLLLFRTSAIQASETKCFCHNIINNPHTICTDNNALKVAHSNHVLIGFDSVGECNAQPSPSVEPSVEPSVKPSVEPSVKPSTVPSPTHKPPFPPFPPRACHAHGGTTVVVNNNNFANVFQSSSSLNISGKNKTFGNIGGGSIFTSNAESTTNQSVIGNSNTTNIEINKEGATNNTNVVNTGSNVFVCSVAAD